MNLVTVEEVKAHLRIDHDELDSVLQDNINAATEAVLDFVDYWVQKNGNDEGKIKESSGFYRVKSAIIIFVGIKYRDPDGAYNSLYQRGELPFPVTSLIYSLHKPVII